MSNQQLIILCTVAILVVIAATVLVRRKIKAKKLIEMRTSAMIDRVSFKRAYINTAYLQKQLFDTVQQLVYAAYAGQKEWLPQAYLLPQLCAQYSEQIDRERNLGIQRILNHFSVDGLRVLRQEVSSMNAVGYIIVEGKFSVDFVRKHSTFYNQVQKQFSQEFKFFNVNNNFLLGEVSKEKIITQQLKNDA